MEYNRYTAYGERTRTQLSQPFTPAASLRMGFAGKEDESVEFGVPYSDFGARHYSSVLSRWLTPDPLGEKYYDVSPYAYCNGDPVNRIDPDGKIIKFASGVSEQFKYAFTTAVKYAFEKGAGSSILALMFSPITYSISESPIIGSFFNVYSKTINWDHDRVFSSKEGVWSSPIVGLLHEFEHALRYNNAILSDNPHDLKSFYYDCNEYDVDYTNTEERRVITGPEQNASQKLGETGEGQVTRTDHKKTDSFHIEVPEYTWEDIRRLVRSNNDEINY